MLFSLISKSKAMIPFIYNDGGREAAGFKGFTGDCVTRAIAIVTEKSYKEVYDALWIKKGTTPRNGVKRKIYEAYLKSLGMKWTPTMLIGQGCKVHLRADELPSGRIICRLSKHLTAVIDGVVNDIYNPAREAHETGYVNGEFYAVIRERCVYGYYSF
jgi:hypothetical protein